MHIDRVTALHCLLEVRWLGTGKMSYIFLLLSVREIDFCTAFEVGSWAATLCQLMVVLYWKLDAGSQLMVLLVGKLVSGCLHTMGPTLGANFCCHRCYLSL